MVHSLDASTTDYRKVKSKDSASGVYFIDDTNTGEEGSEGGHGEGKGGAAAAAAAAAGEGEGGGGGGGTSLAHQSDQRGGRAAFEAQFDRLTMGADLAPLTVTTEQGRRVRVPRAASLSNGRSVARFTFKEICASDSAGSPMGASDYISISQVGDDLVRAGQCVGGSFGLFGSFLTDGLAKCVWQWKKG